MKIFQNNANQKVTEKEKRDAYFQIVEHCKNNIYERCFKHKEFHKVKEFFKSKKCMIETINESLK
jgi:hypothetical protein